MAGKVVILTGAPESASLDWASPDLLSTFTGPIAEFAGLLAPAPTPTPDPSFRHAVWRSIPLERTRVPTGFSQQHDFASVGRFPTCNNFFFTPAAASSETTASAVSVSATGASHEPADKAPGGSADAVLSQFYEHSLAAHDDIPSSQLGLSSEESTTSFISASTSTSFRSTASIDASSTSAPVREPLAPHRGGGGQQHLSDLEDIPSAGYLDSISPQTVTANLIVGVISIASPRAVRTRWGSARSLVEVLVGDETRSGFAVTFWLAASSSSAGVGGETSALAGLRAQDVVLMHNVALHVFRGKVYGSSLRKGLTKVHLLYRTRLDDDDDVGGHYSSADLASARRGRAKIHPQLQKTAKVRDWVLKFVGQGDHPATKKRKHGTRAWDMPPPHDTQ
ncbi:uncharacterized protein E0L32_001365 [Thyridium curvatum]|uniref:Nucleic acid-binding, OB-fold protein n=1 Tax=Thyridium curvatum TaxID=1093900 RepID=A0A507AZE5_9PEZI|nr:uncharacterized protein E0L32_001365 [Thyridium curvatum]TPX10168.1 hypothetical protein E0L32_001365 [Thyridium curvatum]